MRKISIKNNITGIISTNEKITINKLQQYNNSIISIKLKMLPLNTMYLYIRL